MDPTQIISQVGFPIGVAIYVLVVLNKTVAQNTKVMQAIALKLGVGIDEPK
jgi:hypothetical protein